MRKKVSIVGAGNVGATAGHWIASYRFAVKRDQVYYGTRRKEQIFVFAPRTAFATVAQI